MIQSVTFAATHSRIIRLYLRIESNKGYNMRFINDITITGLITAIICFTGTLVHDHSVKKEYNETINNLQVEISDKQREIEKGRELVDNAKVVRAAFGFSDSIVDSLCKQSTSRDCELYRRQIKPMLAKHSIK